MASLITLANLRTQAKQRADQENSNFLSDAEWNSNINNSAKELYDLLTNVNGDYYFNSCSVTTTANNDSYPLPDDFYKLLGVDEIITGTESVSLKPFQYQERNRYRKFSAGGTVLNLHYIPAMPDLVSDTDVFDGVNGYEEYIVVDAAIKALQKEESDCSLLLAQKDALTKRISASASPRDAGKPEKITDVTLDLEESFLRYRIIADNLRLVECYE